jgi:flavin reductase (DIM6/NTAB) family NADH-FMN oxidoreductase RutF
MMVTESNLQVYRGDDFEQLDKRFRTQLINSIPGIKALQLVGTRDAEGQENLAIFNSIFHVGANPPYLGMVVRPDSVDRHTWQNILSTGSFTLNAVGKDFYAKAHQTSARYSKDQSEFEAVGLTPVYREGVFAPFVGESAIKLGLTLQEHHRISCNDTLVVVGEVVYAELPHSVMREDGSVDLVAAGSVGSIGLDGYVASQWLDRLSYAKPDREATSILTQRD